MPAAPTSVAWLETVDSTNAEALRRLASGETGPLWIAAETQTGGRGRNGRTWQSPPGNLHASLLLTLPVTPAVAAQLSLVAGTAVHATISALAQGLPVMLKWPNDLLLGSAKLAGVLIESAAPPGRPGLGVVIGVGMNLRQHPPLQDRPATSLLAHGIETTPAAALARLAEELDRWLAVWRQGAGWAEIRAAWLARAVPVGTPVTVQAGAVRRLGRFAGLAEDGAMLLEGEDGSERIGFGDVQVGMPPAATNRGT